MIGWGGWRELINRCYMSRCLHKMKIRFLSVISLVVKKKKNHLHSHRRDRSLTYIAYFSKLLVE